MSGESIGLDAPGLQPGEGGLTPTSPLQVSLPTTAIRKEDVRLRRIDPTVAAAVSEQKHYLRRARVGRVMAWGVYHRGSYEGVLVFALPPVCRPMFGYAPGSIIELARVWFQSNPKNLGSCAIRRALRLLPSRWPECRAVVSWCDTTRFDCALYKAAGFRLVGTSRARGEDGGRPGRAVQEDRLTPKSIWLIELPRVTAVKARQEELHL